MSEDDGMETYPRLDAQNSQRIDDVVDKKTIHTNEKKTKIKNQSINLLYTTQVNCENKKFSFNRKKLEYEDMIMRIHLILQHCVSDSAIGDLRRIRS